MVIENSITSVRAVLLNSNGDILTIQRSQNSDNNSGLWELPGGKLEPGEPPRDGIVREFYEETGLELDVSRLTEPELICEYKIPDGKHQGWQYRAFGFLAMGYSGRLRLDGESSAAAWRSQKAALALPHLTNVSRLVLSALYSKC